MLHSRSKDTAGLEKGPKLTTYVNSSERTIFLSYPMVCLISDHGIEISQPWINIFLLQTGLTYTFISTLSSCNNLLLVTETWWQKLHLHITMSGNQSCGMRVSNNRFIKIRSLLIKCLHIWKRVINSYGDWTIYGNMNSLKYTFSLLMIFSGATDPGRTQLKSPNKAIAQQPRKEVCKFLLNDMTRSVSLFPFVLET